MSVAYYNKPRVIQGPRSSSVLRTWPLSGSGPSSVVQRHEEEGRGTCGRFSWTRPGWGTVISSQFLLRTQLCAKPNCKGDWGRGCSCGPKRKRKLLHSSSRIKICSHLLLMLLLDSPSASHQVLLVFILRWLSSPLLPPPWHLLLCFSPFCILLCQAPQGQPLPSPALYSQCLQAPYKHPEMFALWKPDRLIFLMHQFQHVNPLLRNLH